jgi:hypothetical protein
MQPFFRSQHFNPKQLVLVGHIALRKVFFRLPLDKLAMKLDELRMMGEFNEQKHQE